MTATLLGRAHIVELGEPLARLEHEGARTAFARQMDAVEPALRPRGRR